MKWFNAIAIGTLALTALGCQKTQWMTTDKAPLNKAMVQHHYNEVQDQAIITQATLFPYHFEHNGGDLNALGKRDMDVLARNYRNNPGALNVRQGDADDELYDARVSQVLDALADRGVDTAGMEVSDGMAGGGGVNSARALLLDERTAEPVQSMWNLQSDWR